MGRAATLTTIWTTTVLSSLALASTPATTKKVGETFRYELHNSDIFAWAEGEREGKVPGSRGPVATALFRFLGEADIGHDAGNRIVPFGLVTDARRS